LAKEPFHIIKTMENHNGKPEQWVSHIKIQESPPGYGRLSKRLNRVGDSHSPFSRVISDLYWGEDKSAMSKRFPE